MSEFVVDAGPRPSLPVRGGGARFPVRRIYCVGRNYVEHAKEMGFTGRGRYHAITGQPCIEFQHAAMVVGVETIAKITARPGF
jgi:2-keto-4-pentenoate hydratase/2-oxohepta-3-ene-1,7-dioic acid hydratase in catechol pathway